MFLINITTFGEYYYYSCRECASIGSLYSEVLDLATNMAQIYFLEYLCSLESIAF